MTEFGHISSRVWGAIIDVWGVGPFIIVVDEKSYTFEDSDRFGPALLKKNGTIRNNPYPPEKSPFWRAHFLWRRQGRKLETDGKTCIWVEPKPTLCRIEGRQLITVEEGEPDGLDINIDTGKVIE